MPEKPILERAFELAHRGGFARLDDLERALREEGYARGDAQLRSPSVRTQLRRLCKSTAAVD